ncbi:uncharacterized protein LOC111260135 isoform X2 [Varroa jacobsoni]|nr:uncharacterized protein LOC111260135 isoform X2 [Varroa jacobsoni]
MRKGVARSTVSRTDTRVRRHRCRGVRKGRKKLDSKTKKRNAGNGDEFETKLFCRSAKAVKDGLLHRTPSGNQHASSVTIIAVVDGAMDQQELKYHGIIQRQLQQTKTQKPRRSSFKYAPPTVTSQWRSPLLWFSVVFFVLEKAEKRKRKKMKFLQIVPRNLATWTICLSSVYYNI